MPEDILKFMFQPGHDCGIYTDSEGLKFLWNSENVTAYQFMEHVRNLHRQNQDYRKALSRILEVPGDLFVDSDLEEDALLAIAREALHGDDVLMPEGSCPCRMEGEVLVACERHRILR